VAGEILVRTAVVDGRNRGKSLVSATAFFEGGGDRESTQSKFRAGFSNYCSKIRSKTSRLKIVAGGGREQTLEKFRIAVRGSFPGEACALIVDAEGPVTSHGAAEHLRSTDGWTFPNLTHHRVFLMVQVMESWFLADRESLAAFYDGGFVENALPGSSAKIETIPKDDVLSGLKRATRNTRSKGEYQKIEHGTVLLGLINPANVEKSSPHAAQFHEFLRSL
jgi:hypothetical protein